MTTDKRLEDVILKALYSSYEMGKRLEPLSDMESEFDLPCIDLSIKPKLVTAIKSHILSVIDKCQTVTEVKKAIGEL